MKLSYNKYYIVIENDMIFSFGKIITALDVVHEGWLSYQRSTGFWLIREFSVGEIYLLGGRKNNVSIILLLQKDGCSGSL